MAEENNLVFKIQFDVQKMQEEIAGIKAKLDSVGTSGSKAFKDIDKEITSAQKAVDDASSKIASNASQIDNLNKKLSELHSAFNAGDIKVGSAFYSQMKVAEDSLNKAKEEQSELNKEYEEASEKLKALKSQRESMSDTDMESGLKQELRETTVELGNLLMKYREMSAAEQSSAQGQALKQKIDELTEKAGNLRDTMDDVNSSIKATASDTGNLDAAVGGLNTMASTIGVAQGAMALFGASSEEAAEIQTKLQSALAISNGLTVIQNNLQKQSALMMGIKKVQTLAAAKAEAIKAKAELSGTAATKAATVAQKIFNAVAKANPYVLLAMALVTVVGALTAFSLGTSEAKKQQEAMNGELQRMANESLAGTIVKIDEMSRSYKKLGDDMEAKKKFIEDNKQAFSELGVSVTEVADADKLLIDNTQQFIRAQKMKALASAARAKAEEVLKEILDKQIEKKEARQRMLSGENNSLMSATNPISQAIMGYKNAKDAYTVLHSDSEEQTMTSTYNKLMNVAEYLNDEYEKKLKEMGVTTTEEGDKVIQYSKQWYEQELSKAKAAYGKLTEGELGSAHAQNLLKQIQNYEDILKKWDTSRKTSSKGIDEYLKQLDNMSKAYKDAFEQMESSDEQTAESGRKMYEELQKSGNDYLDYLKRQRAELDKNADGIADSGKEQDQVHIVDLTNRITEAQKASDDAMKKYDEDLLKNSQDRESFLKELGDGEAETVATSYKERVEKTKKELEKARDEEIAALDKTYREVDAKWVELMTYDYKKQHPMAVQSEIDRYIEEQREKQGMLTADEMRKTISSVKGAKTSADIDKQTADIYKDELSKYKKFSDEYVKITKERNDKIDKLKKSGANQSVIDAVNANYDEQMKALTEGLSEDQITELSDTLDDVLAFSLENLISLAEDTKEKLKEAVDNGDIEKSIKLEAALGKMNERIEQLNDEKNQKKEKLIKSIIGESPEEFIGKVRDMYNAIADLADALGDLSDAEKIGMEIGGNVINNMVGIVENVAQKNWIGAAASAIQLITDTINGTSKWQQAKIQESIDAWQHYADVNLDKLERHIDQLNESRDQVVGMEQYIKSKVIVSEYNKEISVLERQKEELAKLLDNNKLKDEQRKQIEQQIAEIDDQIYETEKKISDEKEKQMSLLTGYSSFADAATAFGDAIINAWENGTDAADAAVGTWEDMIKQFAKQKFLSDFMSKQFEDIFNRYYDTIDGGNMLTEEQQESFRNEITELAENGKEFYANLMESMGLANDIALEGTSGNAIAKASQESIDELNGRFLSVQMFTASISGTVERLYQNSTSIMRDVSDIRGFQQTICNKVQNVQSDLQWIKDNGIRVN